MRSWVWSSHRHDADSAGRMSCVPRGAAISAMNAGVYGFAGAGQRNRAPRRGNTLARLARDRVHVTHGLETLEKPAQLRQVLDLDDGRDHGSTVVVDLHIGATEIDLRLRDDRRDVSQEPGAIPGLDLDGHRIHLFCARLPLHLHQPVGVHHVAHIRTVAAVYRHTLSSRDVSADRLTGDGLAAAREACEHVGVAVHSHESRRCGRARQRDAERVLFRRAFAVAEAQHGAPRADVAVSDSRQKVVEGIELEFLSQLVELIVLDRAQRHLTQAAEFFVKRLAPLLDVLFSPLLLEPLPYLFPGARRLDEAQPVTRRTARTLRRQHLHDVAVLEAMIQRHHAAVHLGTDTAVTDVGVDAVGEVHRRRSLWEGADITARREDEHLVLQDVDPHRVDERLSVEPLLLPVHEQAEPCETLIETRAVGTLVPPVRGHPVLRCLVHLLRADLHLHGLARVRYHGRVQGLIAVALRHRDVVLEATGNRLPQRVDDAERAIAVLDRVDEDAERDDVVALVEVLLAPPHLFVDAVQVLGAAGDLRRHAERFELALENLSDIADEGFALLVPAGQLGLDQVMVVRIELREREVLELAFDLPDAEPVGEWCVDVERLAADPLTPLGGVRGHGAHVVQTIAQLDEDDAHVLRHGDEHLADVLRLVLLRGADVDLAELRDSVDQLGHRLSEGGADVVPGQRGVLDGVVQQGRHERVCVQTKLGKDAGDRQRMLDVGIAGQPEMPFVRVGGDSMGARQRLPVGLREVFRYDQEVLEWHRWIQCTCWVSQPNQTNPARSGQYARAIRATSSAAPPHARQGAPPAVRSARRLRTVKAWTAAFTRSSHSAALQKGALAKTGRSRNASASSLRLVTSTLLESRRSRAASKIAACALFSISGNRAPIASTGTTSASPSTRRTTVTRCSARSFAPTTILSGTPRSSQCAYFSPGRIPSRRSTVRRTPSGVARSIAATASSTTRTPSTSLLRVMGTSTTCTGATFGGSTKPASSPWAITAPPMIRHDRPHDVWCGYCSAFARSLYLMSYGRLKFCPR